MSARRAAGLVVVLIAWAVSLAGRPSPQPLPPMTPEAWRADVDALAKELPKKHANAFHAITRETFDAAIAELRADAAKANDDEMIVGLIRIAAMVGDGHTGIALPSTVHRLPVALILIGDDYRIARAAPAAKDLLGGAVVRINDTPIVEVDKRLRTIVSMDESDALVRAVLPARITVGEVLHGLKITPDATHARITANVNGEEKTVDCELVPGGTNPNVWPTASTAPPPLSRQRGDDPLYFTYIESASTMYVNFRRYDDLGSHSKELWALVDSKPVQKIVFDLRQNGGGDYKVGHKYLVQELISRPKLHAYVLVGNRTFSAAMNNAVQFRAEAHATLVGEPIGEKPNSYQESDEMTLPKSKIVVSYSTRFYKFLPDDAPPIVTPDKTIVPTWDDFVAGRDPVLDWVTSKETR
jgi:hypothetical protein